MSNQEDLSKIFASLQMYQKQFQYLQGVNLKNLQIGVEQVKYFQQHSAEIAQMNKIYSRVQKIMCPLVDMYPQLEKMKPYFQNSHTSTSTKDNDSSEETQDELCIAAQKFVDNVFEHCLLSNQTTDEQPFQDLIFDFSYAASTSSPHALLELLRKIKKMLLNCLNVADEPIVSKMLNILALYQLARNICEFISRTF